MQLARAVGPQHPFRNGRTSRELDCVIIGGHPADLLDGAPDRGTGQEIGVQAGDGGLQLRGPEVRVEAVEDKGGGVVVTPVLGQFGVEDAPFVGARRDQAYLQVGARVVEMGAAGGINDARAELDR